MVSSSSGHRHLDFRRLIKAAERNLKTGPLATASLDERVYVLELNRFSVYVTALREQLSELYSMDVGSIPAVTLQDYSLRLDALERALFTRQQELRAHKTAAGAAKRDAEVQQQQAASGPSTPGVRPRPLPSAGRQAGPASPVPAGGTLSGRGAKKGPDDKEGVSRDDREVLRKQKEEQHRLKDQLEDLVSSLKASSNLIYSNLKDQNQVLDKTGDAAVKNLEGLEEDIKKTEEQLRRAWGNSFTSCLMILVVLATFVATFLVMRLFPKRRLLLW